MQQKVEKENYFFLPQILTLEQQRSILKCPNHNQAISVCVSAECSISGLMCLDAKCQCRRIHLKCHHILLDRVLESVEKHQKQIPQKVKQTYKTIYQMINQMIQKLSKLRNKFQREEQYFGLRQQQLYFMDLINQKKIDQINGKIISSLEKTFDLQIELNKNTKEQIIKDFQLKRKQFDKLCNYIQNNYLQTQEKTKKLDIHQQIFQNSKIIQKEQDRQLLYNWIKQSFSNHAIQSKLLFRASQHNFSCYKFHNLCDDKNDTVVICKNQFNKIIGGFTSIAWNSSTGNQFDKTDRSFMFSLSLKQKYKYLEKQKRSVYCGSAYGPYFGCGADLHLADKCNQNKNSYSNLGCTYNIQINNINKYQINNPKQANRLFVGNENGQNQFKVNQYEVYQIKLKQH